MENNNQTLNMGKSRAILDFNLAKQNKSLGILIASRINMPILEKNFREVFKNEIVREMLNDIASNCMKIIEVSKNKDKITEFMNKSEKNNIAILSLSMIQLESLGGAENYKIGGFFDINSDNVIKIFGEEKCRELKKYLEENKNNLENGANIIIDAVMKSIKEYQEISARR